METRYKVVAAATALTLGAGGVAMATYSGSSGGSLLQRQVRGEDVASTTNNVAWQSLISSSGAVVQVPVGVPRGTSRLITARFTAESACEGPAGEYCSVRLLLRNAATGAIVEMNPKAGVDAAFDSAESGGSGFWEGNTVERFARPTAGTYQVVVQRRVTSAATRFRLDDWMFTVDVNA